MRKVKATIYFPVQSKATKNIELEIPDGVSLDYWIYENAIEIIEREIPSLDDVGNAVDMGHAGITDIEIIKD